MRYKIIGDSCLDLTKEMRKDPCYSMIPLTLMVGERHFVDDETFDQKEFIKAVKEYPECPKSACPSPEMFKEAYCCEEENVFVITLSAALSGSYKSAVLAKSLYEEEHGKKNILVLDSKSASSGQLNIAMYIRELCDQGLEFDEICERAAAYRDRMNTYFVLDNLETLRKNGRLSGIKALVASTLSIKPVMAGTMDGRIEQIGQGIGIRKGLQKMADAVVRNVARPEEKTLMITHCNCPERAESVKRMVTSKVSVKDVVIMDTAGVSSMYANDGGVIVTI